MKAIKSGVVVLGAVLSLSACATASRGEAAKNLAHELVYERPRSIEHAMEIGTALSNEYLDAAYRSRDKRFWINMGRLVLGTAVTVTAGLDVDSETIFLLSAGTQSLEGLDTVINYGGVQAPGNAIATTRCATRSAEPALVANVIEKVAMLRRANKPEYQGALADYDRIKLTMMDRFSAAYNTYIIETTAPLLEVSLPKGDTTPPGPAAPVEGGDPDANTLQDAAISVQATAQAVLAAVRAC